MVNYENPIYAQLHPLFAIKLKAAIYIAEEENLPFDVQNGLRTPDFQHSLYISGRKFINDRWVITQSSKVVTYADAWDSWHNYGLACDCVPKLDGKFTWDVKREVWNAWGKIAGSCGLTWGGRFKNLIDNPHVQWTAGYTIAEAKNIVQTDGIEYFWKLVTARSNNA